jgi:succinate-semialdehyde dehydrogenase/glutarate-semialdehyde dehydrogenase
MSIKSINPTTGALVAEYEPMADAVIDAALERSQAAFRRQQHRSFAARAACLRALSASLLAEQAQLSRLLTEEMGKTRAAAKAEIEKCAWVCRYYAEHGERFLADSTIESNASMSYVRNLPLGPVLAVMPWNFPFWQVFRFAAPALMAGNTALLKHASNVPRAALALEDLIRSAGFDGGEFQTLLIETGTVERVLRDSRVRAATVTGSVTAGTAVAAIAGSVAKKTVLELGGSDAFLVMPSADLSAAVDAAVTSRTINNGQSCIAAKRFIVHSEVHDRFLAAMIERFESLTVGDPMDDGTDVGPLAMRRSRERLVQQIDALIADGATRLSGAVPMDGPGNFVRPGVLSVPPMDCDTIRQELFGPVALVFEADSLDTALAIANDNPYGLGSSIWTRDSTETERAANELDAGATFVNSIVASDPRLPFGGVKSSGYGRELSALGILEFVNRKTVSIA